MPSESVWIESHTDITKKRKTKRLAADLGVDVLYASAHLHALWWHAAEVQQDGDLSDFTDEELAEGSHWTGDAHVFADALRKHGWIDPDGHIHNWWLYFGKYLDRRERNRAKVAAWRDRQRRDGQGELFDNDDRNVTPGDAVTVTRGSRNGYRNGHITDMQPARNGSTGPDRTVPDLTKPVYTSTSSSSNGHVTVTGGEDEDSDGEDESETHTADEALAGGSSSKPTSAAQRRREAAVRVWEYYRERIQPGARICPNKELMARLRPGAFTEEQLRQGIDNFACNNWRMSHNARQGAKWFFKDDAQCETWVLLQPDRPSGTVESAGHGDGAAGEGVTTMRTSSLRQAIGELEPRDLRTSTLRESTVIVDPPRSPDAGLPVPVPVTSAVDDDAPVAF